MHFFLNCCPFYYGFLFSGRSFHCSYLSVAFCFCFSFLLSANDNQHTDGKPVLDCLLFHVGHSFLFSAITHPDVKPSSIHHWCPVFNVCVVILIIVCVCVCECGLQRSVWGLRHLKLWIRSCSGQGVFRVRDLGSMVRLKLRDLKMYYVYKSPHKDRIAREVWGFSPWSLWVPVGSFQVLPGFPHYPKTCICQRGELGALNWPCEWVRVWMGVCCICWPCDELATSLRHTSLLTQGQLE